MATALAEKPLVSREVQRVQPLAEPEDTGVRPYRWTVDELFRAVELGALRNPERLELLDGEIIERMTQNTPHFFSVRAAAHYIAPVLPQPCEVRQRGRWQLTDVDYVEPDVLFVKGTFQDYANRDPRLDEVYLVIEVSETTTRHDRSRKAAKYAQIGVPEYWIINLKQRQVEVHRDPQSVQDSRWGYGYTSVTIFGEGEALSPLLTSAGQINVSDLMPKPS